MLQCSAVGGVAGCGGCGRLSRLQQQPYKILGVAAPVAARRRKVRVASGLGDMCAVRACDVCVEMYVWG